MTDTLPVKDMPDMLRTACLERGHEPTDEMNFADALAEWAAWEIGDAAWADMMLQAQEDFKTDLRNTP